jgi:hypothetical protein
MGSTRVPVVSNEAGDALFVSIGASSLPVRAVANNWSAARKNDFSVVCHRQVPNERQYAFEKYEAQAASTTSASAAVAPGLVSPRRGSGR